MLFAIKQRVCFGEILEQGVKSVDLVEAVEATQNTGEGGGGALV